MRPPTTIVTSVTLATLGGALLAGCGGSAPATEADNSATPVTTEKGAEPLKRGDMCGETRGPDGKLYVHKLGDTQFDCAEAMRVADAFGPKIALAKPQTIDGWQCTFPTTPGVLARCDNGDKAFGFFSSH